MRRIRVTIGADGSQRIEVLDAAGSECLELTRDLEQRLGRQDGERSLKPEFSDAPAGEVERTAESEGAS